MKIVALSEYEFDSFSKNHDLHSYYQTSAYGELMSKFGFSPLYLGFYQGSILKGASLVLSKLAFMGFKYGYAPRGLLVDYTDYNFILELSKELKNYLFKDRFIMLKIDPLVLSSKRDSSGEKIWENEKMSNIMGTLKQADFNHTGFNYLFENKKPRWTAEVNLNDDNKDSLSRLSKSVRTKLRKAIRLGVEIYKDNEKGLEEIYPFIQNKGNYSMDYYLNFKRIFGDKFELYIAKLNTNKYVEGSKRLYEKESEYSEYLNHIIRSDGYKGKDMHDILNKKMESDKLLTIYKNYLVQSIELYKLKPEGIIIGGTIIIKEENTVRLLIDGYHPDYGKFNPLYLSKWKIIEKYRVDKGIDKLDLNAITGLFNDKHNKYKGLNDLKLGFNATSNEYIGEFNLIVNTPIYAIYKNISKDNI